MDAEKKKSKKGLIIVLAVVITAVLAVGTVAIIRLSGALKKANAKNIKMYKELREQIGNITPEEQVVINVAGIDISVTEITVNEYNEEPAKEEGVMQVSGVTKDGNEYKTSGDSVLLDKGDKKLKLTPQDTGKKVDAAKVAGTVSAITKDNGYKKNVRDWNENYGAYYIEAAECILYYPKQLKLVEERENLSLLFKDTRSSATLEVLLDENPYESMQEVENLMKYGKGSKCLAIGNDWYSEERYYKQGSRDLTEFSYVGLGKTYQVRANLMYENEYSFVFFELRNLIKCKFIEDGIWETNNPADAESETVNAAYVSPTNYDPVLHPTTYYVKEWESAVQYPHVFTKICQDKEHVSFTDPKTGALIVFVKRKSNYKSPVEYNNDCYFDKYEFVGEGSIKGKVSYNGETMVEYSTIRSGYMYTVQMLYDSAYHVAYDDAYNILQVFLPGNDLSNMEVQDVYLPEVDANITIPLQAKDMGKEGTAEGTNYYYLDSFYNYDFQVEFWKTTKGRDNIFEAFEVVAEDRDIKAGEDWVKWHNAHGAYIGVVGEEFTGIIRFENKNSYEIYKGIWNNMGISFANELATPSDEVRTTVDELLSEELEAQCTWASESVEEDLQFADMESQQTKPYVTNTGDVVGDEYTSDNNVPSKPEEKLERQETKKEETKKEETKKEEPKKQENAKKDDPYYDDFDDCYEMLTDWYESIYDNMSISKISTPVADSVVCGEANYVEYEYITDAEFEALLKWIEDDGYYRCEYLENAPEDEEFYVYVGSEMNNADTSEYSVILMLDYDGWGCLEATYFYVWPLANPAHGAVFIDYDSMDELWYQDYDILCAYRTALHYDMRSLRQYRSSHYFDYYYRITPVTNNWAYRFYRSGYGQGDYDPMEFIDDYTTEYIYEEGIMDGYTFIPQRMYYYNAVTGALFEVYDDGSLEFVAFTD